MTRRPFSWLPNAAVALALALTACSAPQAIQKDGACTATSKCAVGLVCKAGKCVEDATVVSTCATGDKRCEGDQVETCNADNSGWTVVKTCGAGCDVNTADCNTAVCDPNDQTNLSNRIQCQGDEVIVCKPDGSGWTPVSKCPNGCDQATATCIGNTCRPNQQQCLADGTYRTCKTDGSDWNAPTTCDGQCVDNGLTGADENANCLQTGCTPNALRCDGLTLVQCAADGSAETPVTTCPNQCAVVSGVAQCVDETCIPGATRCSTDGKSVQRCNALGTGWDTSTCDLAGNGLGTCLLARGSATGGTSARCISPVCTPNQVVCQNDTLETCSADGLQETQSACAYGCTSDGTACAPPACAANQYRCDPSSPGAIQVCAGDRRSYIFDQFCAGGCVDDSTTGARCGSSVCSPLIARCTPDGQIQTCSADGRGWDLAHACDAGETCIDNACVPLPATCHDGESRCNGSDVERCVAADGKPASFTKVGACLGTCQGDACDASGECGAIHLQLPLIPAGTSLPGDGQSTILVLSDPLLGPSGLAVPDGTLVTVAADSTDGGVPPRLLSGDSDPATPGLQVPVIDGRIDFLIGAPLCNGGVCNPLTNSPTTVAEIKTQVGGHAACSGTLSVTFDPAVNDRYAAEDFSTTRVRDATAPVSGWNTQKGVLTLNAFDAGDGRDGDLTVPAGQTVDLSTHINVPSHTYPDMASAPVREIRGNLLAIDADPAPFAAPGTRVLLINLQGTLNRASSVGTWEYGTVAGVEGGFVELTAPVARTYGEGGNTEDALADQAVRLIRVPQFRQVTVDGTLTGPAVTSTTEGIAGGVLVFMASGRSDQGTGPSVVSGTITMTAKGFRGADKPNDVGVRTTMDSWHQNEQIGAGAAGYSGEGIEGLRDVQSSVGTTSSAGGYLCGDGNIKPAKTNRDLHTVYPNQEDQYFFGTSGSYATFGVDSCGHKPGGAPNPPECTATGSGDTYGDAMLGHVFLGGGSGSISMSQVDDCADSSHGCYRIGGNPNNACCTTTATSWDGNGISPDPIPLTTYGAPGDCDLSLVPGACRSGPNGNCLSGATLDPNCQLQVKGCTLSTGGCDASCAGAVWVSYCDSRSTLWKQSYPGAPGGGIILATIAELQVKPTGSIESDGAFTGECNVGADQSLQFAAEPKFCYGGAGGSVYVKSESMDLGNALARLHATGGTSGALPGGGDGRIRVDYVNLSNAAMAGATPAYAKPVPVVVTLDGDTAKSLPVMSLPEGSVFKSAQAVVFPAGKAITSAADGSIDVGSANAASGMSLMLSADGAKSYGVVDLATGARDFKAPDAPPPATPAQGSTTLWELSPATGQATGATRGFSVKYTIGAP